MEELEKKLGLDKLEPEERKRLFEEFVKKGGKVLSPLEQSRLERMHKTSHPVPPPTAHKKSTPTTTKEQKKVLTTKPKTLKKEVKTKITESVELSAIESFWTLLTLKLSGVLRLFSNKLTNRFMSKLIEELDLYMLELKSFIHTNVWEDEVLKERIISLMKLNKVPNPQWLLYKLYEIYPYETFKKLHLIYAKYYPIQGITIKEFANLILPIYKLIYILFPHIKDIRFLLRIIGEELRNTRGGDPKEILKKQNELLRNINKLFYDWNYKIRAILSLYLKKKIVWGNPEIEKLLGITPEDFLVETTEKSEKEETKEEVKEETQEQKETERDIIESGLSIINSEQFVEIYKNILETSHLVEIMEGNDKMLLLNTIYELFEREFYHVLTYKVKYNVSLETGRMFDPRKELENIYLDLNEFRTTFEDYVRLLKEIKKVENDSYLSISQKSSLLNSYSIDRNRMWINSVKEMRKILNNLLNLIFKLYEDAKNVQKFVQNPKEVITFEKTKEEKEAGKKYILEGETVEKALEKSFAFVKAWLMLMEEGDLSGYGTKLENPKNLKIPNIYEVYHKDETKEENPPST